MQSKVLDNPGSQRLNVNSSYSQTMVPHITNVKKDVLSPHPRSDLRQRSQNLMDPELIAQDKEEYRRIQESAPWMPSSKSSTYKPMSTMSNRCEYKSLTHFDTDKTKHIRSNLEPQGKFDRPVCSSHDFSWNLKSENAQNPEHGLHESFVTKFHHNMMHTHSYHILRQ
eukprot:GDKJ01004132.1.p1 GENE.GDKJ01004132.1~~GDKJ01004132.1.p1  ORF type:complete len:168 (+),score=13.12 GDKJ01004132.1:20-523(+)